MSPPPPRIPMGSVTEVSVDGSILVTEPSAQFRVQTPPSPAARNRGSGPAEIVAVTRSVTGSIRWTEPAVAPSLLAEFVIHTAPKPKAAQYDRGKTLISAMTSLLAASILVRTPPASLSTQMDPAPAARLSSPSASARPVLTRATTVPDIGSTR